MEWRRSEGVFAPGVYCLVWEEKMRKSMEEYGIDSVYHSSSPFLGADRDVRRVTESRQPQPERRNVEKSVEKRA